jgi:hybrid polyketide synthase/nonribosomal peptide synthetase ACE1
MTDEETNVAWYNNPVFSHCIIEAKSAEPRAEDQTRNKATALPVAEQLSGQQPRKKPSNYCKVSCQRNILSKINCVMLIRDK